MSKSSIRSLQERLYKMVKDEKVLQLLQENYAEDIIQIMRRKNISFLSAKLFIMDIICSDEVKELVIREL